VFWPFFVLYGVYIGFRINRKKKVISEALAKMAAIEPQWAEERLLALARERFMILQAAWGNQDLDTIEKYLHPALFRLWQRDIRSQQARHERFLHLWGIASGLDVTGKEKQTAAGTKYQEITLSPGVAIDGTGREIVVPEAERLSDDLFDQLNVAIADKDAWYPVFLIGRDEPAPGAFNVHGIWLDAEENIYLAQFDRAVSKLTRA